MGLSGVLLAQLAIVAGLVVCMVQAEVGLVLVLMLMLMLLLVLVLVVAMMLTMMLMLMLTMMLVLMLVQVQVQVARVLLVRVLQAAHLVVMTIDERSRRRQVEQTRRLVLGELVR